jgi:4-methylaminobutanoate oxidase (formaldehyde-forming)
MVVGVQERYSATFDARLLPDDINTFSPTQGDEHWDVLAEAVDPISKFFPTVLQAEFSNYVSGLSTYTPDGQILLGAVCGNGIALSAGIGSAISALVRNEESAFDLAPFAPDRFGSVDPCSQAFRDLCAAARAAKSAPTDQFSA